MNALADHFRAGSGPPLLLVHGFTATHRAWGPVPELLSEQFDVLAPTGPGHTGGPDIGDGHPVDAMLDAHEAMLDEVGWERAHVAGWSMGGQLALELAVRGRALSVTALSPAGAHGPELDRVHSRTERLFRRDHGAARRSVKLVDRLARSEAFRAIALRNQMLNGARISARDSAAMMRDFAQTPVFEDYLEQARARQVEGLERIDVPVTIAWGDTDRVLPRDDHEPFYRERLPDARYVTLKKAGHTPFWDAPERVADVIAQTALRAERNLAR
jgi:pimeloyl-ACP methyl ester carboxylesterase